MPLLKPCLDCGVPQDYGSRCKPHTREYEKRRDDAEPWRRFYDDPRWFAVRTKVIARDEHRCTYAVSGKRCAAEFPLSVHHKTKLRHLWAQAGKPQPGTPGWSIFVRRATDMRDLTTMCERHHKLVDNTNPEKNWVGIPPERATSGARRNRNYGRRRTRKRRNEQSEQRARRRGGAA